MAANSESISVDMSSFKNLARDIRRAAPELSKELKSRLRAAGAGIVALARAKADYSTRIPPSIKAGARGTSVVITAGGAKAPNAAPIENKGKGHVRHPVFVPKSELPGPPGSWTSENSHPAFLAPAALEGAEAAQAQVALAVDAVIAMIADKGAV